MKIPLSKYVGTTALILSLALVCYPRFDRQDLGPIRGLAGKVNGKASLGDATYYANYVDHFRGKATVKQIGFPFLYRPLAPLMASFLPIKNPMTAINFLNLICLYIGLFFLFFLLKSLGFGFWYSLTGCFMFSISFPTFYYGTDGCIDPVLICLLVIGTYLIFKGKWLYFALILALGSLVKEIIVLLIPVSLAFLLEARKPWKLKLAIFLLACLIPAISVRFLFRESGSYYWYPSIERFMSNIRVRALLSVLLSFGLPGFLSLFFSIHYQKLKRSIERQSIVPLFTGIFFCVLLVIYAMVSAYTDGRFIWPLSIYTIPISLWFLRGLRGLHLKVSETHQQSNSKT